MVILMFLLRALLALAAVLFLIGLVRAVSNFRLVLSGRNRRDPASKKNVPPFNPKDVVDGQWEEIETKE